MPLILSCIMSAIISLVNIIKALGFVENLLPVWLQAWVISWLIAYPTVLMVLPIVKWIVVRVVESPASTSDANITIKNTQ